MKTELENNVNERIRTDLSYNNFHKIIDKKLPYKFSYLDECLLKKSKLLANEAEIIEDNIKNPLKNRQQRFRTYKRGTIVKVDFGIGLNSEMSQIHFAIVLNNYDNPKNSVLTVVPLTSKENNFNLYLGALITNMLLDRIEKESEEIQIRLNKNENLTIEEYVKLNKLNTLVSYYKSNIKCTYACCTLITTVSKKRIFLPVNEYDIIGRAKCSNEIMDKIDKDIRDKFTLTSSKK